MKWPSDPVARHRMVKALLDWVEELDRAEPRPEGVDADAAAAEPDLFATVGAIEALRTEVGLQGRELARIVDADREAVAHAAGRREVLGRLLEARDRLARSLDVARSGERGFTRGLFGAGRRRKALHGLLRGLEVNLSAVDDALREFDCREIPAVGRPFDPGRMRAVEAADRSEGAPGTVVTVVRSGWLAGNEVLRPAEVRAVPGAAGGAKRKEGEDE